jgi:hypothetical protein
MKTLMGKYGFKRNVSNEKAYQRFKQHFNFSVQ